VVAALAAAWATLFTCVRPASAQLPAPPVMGTGPFQVGGYAALTLSRPERPETAEQLTVSELSAALLGWGQISRRASYLVELDMAKRTSETWTGRETDQRLVPVRMYLEYTANELFRFRLGRFLTPVGQWNERHAEPLTWTPTRPLTTYRPFAKSLTGLMVAGEGLAWGHDVGYALFWAPSGDLDGDLDEPEESAFVNAVGARIAAEIHPGLTLGASLARVRRSRPHEVQTGTVAVVAVHDVGTVGAGTVPDADGDGDVAWEGREEDPRGRALLGGDLRWETPSLELTAEGVLLPSTASAPYEGGAFGMAAIRLHGPLWAVLRAERYYPVDDRSARLSFAGLTLRADRHFVAKFGRQFSQHPSIRIPDGWFLSFSSLF
jgi:hypothetical protein